MSTERTVIWRNDSSPVNLFLWRVKVVKVNNIVISVLHFLRIDPNCSVVEKLLNMSFRRTLLLQLFFCQGCQLVNVDNL